MKTPTRVIPGVECCLSVETNGINLTYNVTYCGKLEDKYVYTDRKKQRFYCSNNLPARSDIPTTARRFRLPIEKKNSLLALLSQQPSSSRQPTL